MNREKTLEEDNTDRGTYRSGGQPADRTETQDRTAPEDDVEIPPTWHLSKRENGRRTSRPMEIVVLAVVVLISATLIYLFSPRFRSAGRPLPTGAGAAASPLEASGGSGEP